MRGASLEGEPYVFTSESVTEGHPDKVADLVSDAVLDACLEQDPNARVACETLVKSDVVVLAGEVTCAGWERIDVEAVVREALVPRVLGDWNHGGLRVTVNPAGAWTLGGPSADAGLTGRKTIVDTYGGMARHGGGAFSGKDASKVDRSGAYFCRWIARQVVERGLARRAEVQVSYAIGRAEPVSVFVETFGTGDAREASAFVRGQDFRPGAIARRLGLLRPIYRSTTNYGHFGRPELPWEASG